jgi:hypothetical protein
MKPAPILAIALVLLAALGFRIAVLLVSLDTVPMGDSYNYFMIVKHMLAGRGMVFDDPLLGSVWAQFPPLLPFLLYSASLVFGISPATITGLNFLSDIATAAGLVWLGRQTGLERPAWFAAAVYLLWPANIVLAPMAQKEPLVTALAMLVVNTMFKASKRGDFAPLLGLASGLLALAQPALAPFPIVLGIMFRKRFEHRTAWLQAMAVAAISACAVMLPWWVRNWFVLGQFVPLTTGGGLGLWIGSNPSGDGTWMPTAAHLIVGNEIAVSRAAAKEAWAWISAAPLDYVARCLVKVLRAFRGDIWPGYSLWLRDPTLGIVGTTTIRWNLYLLSFATTGLVLRPSKVLLMILAACFAEILIFQFWFEFSERHRYFVTPFLMMAAANLLVWQPVATSTVGVGDDQ